MRGRPGFLGRLRQLLTVPILETEEETRKAERLHTILLALLVLILVLTPFYLFYLAVQPGQRVEILLLLIGSLTIFSSALILLLQGRLRPARILVNAYVYLAIIVTGLVFDGLYDSALTAFFLLTGVVGLISGGRAALFSAVAGTAGLTTIFVVDWHFGGFEVPKQPPLVKLLETSGFLLLLGLVLRMTLADRNEALKRAREEVQERKKVEQSLRKARDRLEERVAERTSALTQANRNLETLIETNRDGVIFLTGAGELTILNTRALELLGLPGDPNTWVGRHLDELLAALPARAPLGHADLEREFNRLTGSKEMISEGEIQLADRFIHWYYTTTLVEEDLPAQLLVVRDVTARRQAERMRNDLISTMVHDLRNPLSSMLSLLSTLTWMDAEGREMLTTRQRRYVERSMDTVRQMNQLVSNILDVSRLESRQMPLQPEEIPLREIVLETVSAQQPLASQKELLLVTEIPPGLPPVKVDVGLFERILQNLLDNAIKFTPAGGEVRVLARLVKRSEQDQPMIEIAVADTGLGIQPALKKELFQKFVAGDGDDCGSGLGLAFCKLAVEAHGGQIAVESEVGKGSVFTLSLPAP